MIQAKDCSGSYAMMQTTFAMVMVTMISKIVKSQAKIELP